MSKSRIDRPSHVSKLPSKDAEFIKGVPVDDSALADDYMLVYDAATETLGYESGPAPGAHTIASHSDTTATGTELETLTDGSNADALHAHAGGSGDVVGPAGATDHAIPRFNTGTGKLIQDSALTISDEAGGSVTIDYPSAGDTQLFLTNSGAGDLHVICTHDFGVLGSIVVTGTVDGVDVAALSSAYTTHAADGTDPHGASETLTTPIIGDFTNATHGHADAPGGGTIKLDDWAAPDDNTDLDASTSEHGLLRKLDNDDTHYLDGKGAWTVPAGGGGGDVSWGDQATNKIVRGDGSDVELCTTAAIDDSDNLTGLNDLTTGGDLEAGKTIGFTAIHDNGEIDGEVTIDWRLGNWQTAVLTGDVTGLAFIDPPNVGVCHLRLIQDGDGDYEVVWDDVDYWIDGGATPVMSTPPNARDWFDFRFDGSIHEGSHATNYA